MTRVAGAAARGGPGLIIFSPLPPMATGIADYSFELLPLLAADNRCIVVVEDGPRDWRVPDGVTLLTLAQYEAGEAAHAGTLHLYHVGNNPDHVYMLPVMRRHPGVVVLHDPGLHHLLDCATAALGDIAGYRAAVEAEYGAPGRVLVDQWRDHELRDQAMLYGMRMLRQLLGPARHVAVHSAYAAGIVRAEAPGVPVTVVPHQYATPKLRGDAAALRARLGIGDGEMVFLSLGFVSHIKRVDTALRALARVTSRLPPFRYVVAGAIRADELDVEALARQLGLADRVVTTGYVAEDDFFDFVDMADVVINLRWPVGGETSGTLIRALGSGACVVVVDAGPFAELPDDAAIRLPWGPRFEIELSEALLRLAAFPAMRFAVGAAAARWIGERHQPDVTQAAYRGVIDAARGAADRPWRRDAPFVYAPVHLAADPGAPLWGQVRAMPLDAGETVLARGTAADAAGLQALGHRLEEAGDGWRPDGEGARGRDLLFLRCEAGDGVLGDELPERLNRVLRFGGAAVLCVVGGDPAAETLASRHRGEPAWNAAGFRVELCEAAPMADMRADAGPGEDELVWRVVKVSEFIARLPPVRRA